MNSSWLGKLKADNLQSYRKTQNKISVLESKNLNKGNHWKFLLYSKGMNNIGLLVKLNAYQVQVNSRMHLQGVSDSGLQRGLYIKIIYDISLKLQIPESNTPIFYLEYSEIDPKYRYFLRSISNPDIHLGS